MKIYRIKFTVSFPAITSTNVHFGELIGKGSFAEVYRGKWEGKDVALKKMKLPSEISLQSLPTIQEIEILRFINI